MKRINNIILLLILILLSGCEKDLAKEDSPEGGNETSGITSEQKTNALTISEAMKVDDGTQICVKGFIVGATKQSIGNTEYAPSFNKEYTTAIVLANMQANNTNTPFGSKEVMLFPVCLTDASKGIRDAYNLPNHESYWNQFVYISGTKETYMSLDGMKKVKAVEIDPNHVVTDEEKAKNNNEDDNPNDNEDNNPNDDEDNNPNDDDNSNDNGNSNDNSNTGGNSGNNDSLGDKIYSVAEAKAINTTSSIQVKGYIVGAVLAGTELGNNNVYFDRNITKSVNKKELPFYGIVKNIVLADKPYQANETFDTVGLTDLLPVNLEDSQYQGALNLADNPDNQNKLVIIIGKKGYCVVVNAIEEVDNYKWITIP